MELAVTAENFNGRSPSELDVPGDAGGRLGEALAETAKRMRECIVRALGVHARILPAELKCGKLRTEQGAPAQPSHYDMYEGATDIECWAAIKPVTGKYRDFYIRPGSHKAVRAGKGIIQAEAKVRVYDDEILLISSLVVHRGGEGPSRDNGAPGCTDQQASSWLITSPTRFPRVTNGRGLRSEVWVRTGRERPERKIHLSPDACCSHCPQSLADTISDNKWGGRQSMHCLHLRACRSSTPRIL